MLTFLELIIQEKVYIDLPLYIVYLLFLLVYFHYAPIKEDNINLSILMHG